MPRAGVVPRGAAFLPALAAWVMRTFAEGERPLVVVPHARAAERLRGIFREHGFGRARVLALRGDAAMAELAGVEMPAVAAEVQVRAAIAGVLAELQPGVGEARLPAMAASLRAEVGKLATYGVTRARVREVLPESLAMHWEVQGEMVERAMAAVEALGAPLREAAGREVFAALAERGAAGWVPVVAGIVDAPVAATAAMAKLAERGWVVVPAHAGDVGEAWLAALGAGDVAREEIGVEVQPGVVREVVCATPWEEVRWVAAEIQRAEGTVAVVTGDRTFVRRLRGELAAVGIALGDSAGVRFSETAAGEVWGRVVACAADRFDRVAWRALARGVDDMGAVSEALKALPRRAGMAAWCAALARVAALVQPGWEELEGAKEIQAAWDALAEIDGEVEGGEACAWLRAALRDNVAPCPGDGRAEVMGPREARLFDFAHVLVPRAVEGVWPGREFGEWLSDAHARALGLPDSGHTARLMGAQFSGLVEGGSGRVVVTRALREGEAEVVASRFLQGVAREQEHVKAAEAAAMPPVAAGVWQPRGEQLARVWSASFVEALMACPYKAYAERILKMLPLDPLEPVPDARVGGLLVHAWLERMGREFTRVDAGNAEQVLARMQAVAEELLAAEDEAVRAVWRPKMRRMAPALVDRWVRDGRQVEMIEQDVRREVEGVVYRALVDRVETGAEGRVVLDYKTGTVPSWKDVKGGVRPQLALEAWLLGGVSSVEYWKLRGFGARVIEVKGLGADEAVAPVAEGTRELALRFGVEGAPYPALPDMREGGLNATGHCEYCALADVCRRREAVR